MENYSNAMPQVAGQLDPAYYAAKEKYSQPLADGSRTFDGIREALNIVLSIRQRTEEMLDRVAPVPRDIASGNKGEQSTSTSYAYTLCSLHDELRCLAGAVEALASHI